MSGNKVFLGGLLIIILVSSAFAEIPTPVKDVVISGSIKVDAKSNLYTYEYAVSNPAVNKEKIFLIEIDISKPPSSQALSAEGLIIQRGITFQGVMRTETFKDEVAQMQSVMEKEVIPVGMQTPSGWRGGIAVIGTVLWGSGEEFLISPMKSVDGFKIVSYGLPSIRDASFQPSVDTDNLPEEYWENVELTKQLYDSLEYHTKTIGPTAPPADLKPLEFLDYIISIKHEAYSLGWIKNKGIEQGLDAKLDAAKKKLSQGNTKAAKDILGAFVNEVEAQGCETYEKCPPGKHLTPEAYALLKYNAQYLVERL